MKIGFFDSGLGGLTVLSEAIKEHGLSEDIYYLADTKNTPYGVKEKSLVKDYIFDNIKYLVNIGCNPIVIACNTATTLCIKELRQMYKDIIFIGTEPAVKVAHDSNSKKKILVIATSITVSEEKLLNLIEELNMKEQVELESADRLVTLAEDINFNDNKEEINSYIKELLQKYDLKDFSHIVLGCTHFPLFRDNMYEVIAQIYGKLDIKIVDGAQGISNNLIRKICEIRKNSEYLPDEKRITIITTSVSDTFKIRAKQILNDESIVFDYKLQ